MKNMNNFSSFKNLKKGTSLITEDVIQMGSDYRVRGFDVPISLINAFKKKAKDSGNDISGKFADTELAEFITKYIQTKFLTIDNLPLELLGEDYSNIQIQPQTQTQPQTQETQPTQNSQAQETAQNIPAQENGQTQQTQSQNSQSQNSQSQNSQSQNSQGQNNQTQEI